MKTAIQQAIEDYFEFAGRERMSGNTVARILKDYLEKEKHQIIDAFTKGNREEFYDGSEELGLNYFNETFKQE